MIGQAIQKNDPGTRKENGSGAGGRSQVLAGLAIISLPTIAFFFPLIKLVGRVFQIPNEKLEKSFIELHNRIERQRIRTHRPSELLLLLPRCLQDLECPERVVLDYKNCKACGNCEIGGIVKMCESKGVRLSIATGGEFARKLVMETHPHAIVAVGCERELVNGILETASTPSYAVINERPEGPCRNTKVDMKLLEEAVSLFLDEQCAGSRPAS
ncbi:MAG: DUF116 domain-containing protein [Candidatus Eisenbacteria bacterium]|nr:DUF116 domain-containing protein [Candidatus Eisenbacteria bacterium]